MRSASVSWNGRGATSPPGCASTASSPSRPGRGRRRDRDGNRGRGVIAEFIRHLADGRQLSPHTVAAYRRDLTEF
ncbi:MAG: site-specific integrase, partial [Gemmatimonadota bacterium]